MQWKAKGFSISHVQPSISRGPRGASLPGHLAASEAEAHARQPGSEIPSMSVYNVDL